MICENKLDVPEWIKQALLKWVTRIKRKSGKGNWKKGQFTGITEKLYRIEV